MTDHNFTTKQQQMLDKANDLIKEASLGYKDILQQHILDLNDILQNSKLKEAIALCNVIHSQAATFGWDLITEVAGWFKRLLINQVQNGEDSTVNNIFLKSFDDIIQNDLKTESQEAIALLKNIEIMLKKENAQ